jgi:sortase A
MTREARVSRARAPASTAGARGHRSLGTPAQRRRRRRIVRLLSSLALAIGLVLSLVAVYQLWWTNVAAARDRVATVQRLTRSWTSHNGARPAPPSAAPERGSAFAIISIPRFHALGASDVFPVVEGFDRPQLDRGAVGHGPGTAMPGAVGNFVLAAHRSGHGEPFRHLDKLRVGDTILITTAADRYTYVLDRQLPRTTPADLGVMAPVPHKLGVTGPGRYLTLITCTPRFSTRYRMVWWGHLRP